MYDLIIRDATIVSSAGRQVADVAVKGGMIAYVGPRPPRSAKRELSAIGRFLMPGVIDTAALVAPDDDGDHWRVESAAAVTGGVTTVLGVPTGDTPLTGLTRGRARLDAALPNSWCDVGLWGLAGQDNRDELAEAVSSGLMVAVLAVLGHDADCIDADVLASFVHAPGALGVQVLEPEGADQEGSPEALAVLRTAREHDRAVHWLSLSTTSELNLLDPVRGDLPVTAGVTPQHLFLSAEEDAGVVTRPAVRPEKDRRTLWTALRRGRIDCLASGHCVAPPGGQGVPSVEVMLPLMLSAVRNGRLSLEQLVTLCSESPARVFGLGSKGRVAKGYDADLVLFSEGEITRIQEGSLLSRAGTSPYVGREAAPKPELVMVGGEVVAVRGEIVADAPRGRAVQRA